MPAGSSVDLSVLESVLKKTISAVESSKEQIFDIAENARKECMHIQFELGKIKQEVAEVIKETDQLEHKYRLSRILLVEVSRNFKRYTEDDIKRVYEQTSEIQIQLQLTRQKEKNLRDKRSDLERRLRNLSQTINKADNLMAQIGVVLGYLKGDLGQFQTALESAQQSQWFGLQIIQAQEEERRRVARDIHDGPAQSMAHLLVRTEIIDKMLLQGQMQEVRSELKELREDVRNTLADVRKIIFDLRPMALDDLGLIPTLRKYLEEYEKRYSICTELVVIGSEQRLSSTVEVGLFRLIQEALSNAGKHSKAKKVELKIEFQQNQVTVLVRDDGVGFKKQEMADQPQFGMIGMNERMKHLNGKLEIASAPGQGTKVKISVPISR